MPLSFGLRLGPYEIQAPLGVGGMGEVYKAVDTRLKRTVAIKVLPSGVATTPESRQRLQREALPRPLGLLYIGLESISFPQHSAAKSPYSSAENKATSTYAIHFSVGEAAQPHKWRFTSSIRTPSNTRTSFENLMYTK